MLMFDSCLMICDAYLKGTADEKAKMLRMLDLDSRSIAADSCDQRGDFQVATKDMMRWIKKTLHTQSRDPNIAWKVSFDHHPLYGIDNNDYSEIIHLFLPEIMEHKYDVFFNGHEHMTSYAQAPKKTKNGQDGQKTWWDQMNNKVGATCDTNLEIFPNSQEYNPPKFVSFEQGEAFHQVTIGNSGREFGDICTDFQSSGNFYYA